MACWQRNWQPTHPPAAARRRWTEPNTVTATAAASTAQLTATAMARTSAAVWK
jgi:hypothetical protein